MRRALAAALLVALAGHALAAPSPSPDSAQARLDAMRGEARDAARRAERLERAAVRASGEAEKFARQRLAIVARIEAIDTELAAGRLLAARLGAAIARTRAELDAERAPAAALLAGLATQARQPPVLALAGSGSLDELVRTQGLIEALLPTIDARTTDVRARAARLARLEARLIEAQAGRAAQQAKLAELREALSGQQEAVTAEAAAIGIAAAREGTRALAAEESTARLSDDATREAFGADIAAALASYAAAPRPPADYVSTHPLGGAPFTYRLPAAGRIVAGLGSLDADGVRARGLKMRVAAGSPIVAPADGTIRYAGAFRGRDGVIVIDHGDGWHSLLAGVASALGEGDRVRIGERIGTARGALLVELWDGRRPRSPALIASSS